ncbi:uncharacterized protein TRAVEDRAFT_50743 [Trametes versicolor FP-101664 SS1]|uniref:uncharacterized protein n=1 Tax=Trametes versicolor (strain FP-101664) TaxID=717944 RepID=UPI0004622122|nr:uncharacterized protein TRAVEDRAFT_50743 [Trametes versicolor FP-101664 SS1]EIW54606.1 hypothetical protein TRAVEDRAFT_50743 [Trametes versicolor FP-101664 SS1]
MNNNSTTAKDDTYINSTRNHPGGGHPAYGDLPPEYLPYLTAYGAGDDLELDFDYEAFAAMRSKQGRSVSEAQGVQRPYLVSLLATAITMVRGLTTVQVSSFASPATGAHARFSSPLSAIDGEPGNWHDVASEGSGGSDAEEEPQKTCLRKPRMTYSSADHEALVRVAIDVNPWGAAYRQKGKAWQTILETLQKQQKFLGASVGTIRNKMDAMIAWQADNNCAQGRIINDLSDSTKHALAALLDRASELKAMAEHATEEEKAKAQKKAEDDRIGGEAIRSASLATFRKRKRGEDTESESDAENRPPAQPPKRGRLAKSASSTTSSFEQRDTTQKLVEVIAAGQQRQEEFQKQVLTQMQATNDRCLRVLENLATVVAQRLSRSDTAQ